MVHVEYEAGRFQAEYGERLEPTQWNICANVQALSVRNGAPLLSLNAFKQKLPVPVFSGGQKHVEKEMPRQSTA
jgi:hypothetical protein